jgi:AraC family transcriptional activator of pobA
MARKTKSIPVNVMANEFGAGISIEKMSFNDLSIADKELLNTYQEGDHSHRHDGHSFFLLEKGSVSIEIDFENYTIVAPSIMYVHPDQVHCTRTSKNVIVSSCSMTDENLNPEYLKLLEDMTPVRPLQLDKETFTVISETVSLCIKFNQQKNTVLYHSLLRDSCNALVALIISQYLQLTKPTDKLTRFEIVTKTFRRILERNYTMTKSPAEYAEMLNLSAPYLNECVKNTTGYSVSYHIQRRIILEAKRLLSHSDKSVKEISAMLGYDDYPYFSRLFVKVTGTTALAFRNKNLD